MNREEKCSSCQGLGTSPFCSKELTDYLDRNKQSFFLAPKAEMVLTPEQRENVFVVRDGVVKLFTEYEGAKSLEILSPGSFFGGGQLLGVKDWSLRLVGGTGANICMLDSGIVDTLTKSDSKFLRSYMVAMSLYLAGMRVEASEVQSTALKARLAKQLYKDFRSRGYVYAGMLTVTKILSHDEWALLLRSRRESVTRAFGALETEGVISVKSDSIALNDEFLLLRLIADARAA